MRRVVVSEFVSLDGVMEDPGGAEGFEHGGWTFPYWNDEIGKLKLDEILEADALLLGRVTYEGFAAVWPSMTDEQGFADRMNSLPKFVASTTLKEPEWQNTTVIEGDTAGEIAELKADSGQDILVAGSTGSSCRRWRNTISSTSTASSCIQSSWEAGSVSSVTGRMRP
ncbi:MAG TPA: dihydrofolate reductase family protein [Gaiellaceae bacterium]|jgi:dihydrofolate reductase